MSASEKQHTGQPPRGWQVQATLSIPQLRDLCLGSTVLRAVPRLCQAPRIFRGLRTVGESTLRGRRFRQDLGLLPPPHPPTTAHQGVQRHSLEPWLQQAPCVFNPPTYIQLTIKVMNGSNQCFSLSQSTQVALKWQSTLLTLFNTLQWQLP